MARKDKLFRAFWISIDDRLPPDTDDPILIWLPEVLHCSASIARVLRTQQEQIREKLITNSALSHSHMKTTGYFATHWMYIFYP